ncbi:MAG: hypothetical protein AB7K36_30585, partial [Chloroflexota bacterium]
AIRAAVARTRDQERVTGLPVLLQAGLPAPSGAETTVPSTMMDTMSVMEDTPARAQPSEDAYDDHYAISFEDTPYEPMPDDWPDD